VIQHRYKVPFVLASTAHGPVILSAIDWRPISGTHVEFGVGTDLLISGEYDTANISMVTACLEDRRQKHGAGAVALDCGANIGIYTMDLARAMEGWGQVLSFEPQERIYYALCGNLAINNIFNAKAHHVALGAKSGQAEMPIIDYQEPNQYGGIALGAGEPVAMIAVDDLGLKRLDFLKIDVEGHEVQVLEGARKSIEAYKPYMFVEWHICGKEPLEKLLKPLGFELAYVGMNAWVGQPGPVMERFKHLSKLGEEYHERTSKQDIRAGLNGGAR